MTVLRAALAAAQLRILRFYKHENSAIFLWHTFKTIANISISQNPFLGRVQLSRAASPALGCCFSAAAPSSRAGRAEQPWASRAPWCRAMTPGRVSPPLPFPHSSVSHTAWYVGGAQRQLPDTALSVQG